MGSAHRLIAPYQAIRCADGFITLAAANQRLFERLCAVLGHPEWATDPDYATGTGRVRHRAALAHLIESQTIARSCADWIALFSAHDIPCGPINTYDQLFADPQVEARQMAVDTVHPALGRLRTLGSPMKMSETPPVVGRPAPTLGEHTAAVLREIAAASPE
jgi:crotonobetainyl-CoA:carnitine CoA-transferase CaiB-like acyl-CoA transferase